jgi:hypothetical protein
MPAIDWDASPNLEAVTGRIVTIEETPAVFNSEELRKAVERLPRGKAPGA